MRASKSIHAGKILGNGKGSRSACAGARRQSADVGQIFTGSVKVISLAADKAGALTIVIHPSRRRVGFPVALHKFARRDQTLKAQTRQARSASDASEIRRLTAAALGACRERLLNHDRADVAGASGCSRLVSSRTSVVGPRPNRYRSRSVRRRGPAAGDNGVGV